MYLLARSRLNDFFHGYVKFFVFNKLLLSTVVEILAPVMEKS